MSNPNSSLPPAAIDSGTTLYGKTAIVATGMLGLGAIGAALTPSMPGWLLFVLSIAWLIYTFAVIIQAAIVSGSKELFGAKISPVTALSHTALWSLISGIVSGPMLAMYVKDLGPSVVFSTFLGCCASAAIAGGIGMALNCNLQRLGTVLYAALWALIIMGIVGAFVALTPTANLWISVIGMVVFLLYFVFDFNRLKNLHKAGGNDWGLAIIMGMQLYLDLINLFFYALRARRALNK